MLQYGEAFESPAGYWLGRDQRCRGLEVPRVITLYAGKCLRRRQRRTAWTQLSGTVKRGQRFVPLACEIVGRGETHSNRITQWIALGQVVDDFDRRTLAPDVLKGRCREAKTAPTGWV